MGQVIDVFTGEQNGLVKALKWSSVGGATGVGCFTMGTGNTSHIDDIRGAIRSILYVGSCYEYFPK